MDLRTLGLKIKHFRQSKGLTQKQLSEEINTTWEMISRYETGKSSPLNKIFEISKALEVPIHIIMQDNQLSENFHQNQYQYERNLIPFVNKEFKDIKKSIDDTKEYYTAPDWIIKKFMKPFAISCELLIIETTKIEKEGILMATLEQSDSQNDLVIIEENNNYSVINVKSIRIGQKVAATVIAWEKRFK
ncbi:helix-turn-helix transcriptional regulator [Candidatus Dojkabacteria bacterium]|nr:helix-turn-helix transcriptional regulator [Candidatus Dojkabacteria bacterium]